MALRDLRRLRDGPSLTPLVLSAILFLPQAGPRGQAALDRGADYLTGFVNDEGKLKVADRELLFPVYTAASAARVVVLVRRDARTLRAQAAWLAYLRGRQLNEALGWKPSDPEYGGWGFSLDLPRKPAAGQPKELLHESNLAATIFALAALRSAKAPAADPAYAEALGFVERARTSATTRRPATPSSTMAGSSSSPVTPRKTRPGRPASTASTASGSVPTAP